MATTIGVVGLGAMGSRIARRLCGAGYRVVVWNRSPEAITAVTAAGALPAQSPAEVARRADAVITMVSEAGALAQVLDGPEGILAEPSVDLIQMSTIGVQATAQLSERLPSSVNLLDAPVLGSIAEAEQGTLTVLMSGPSMLVRRWADHLAPLGTIIDLGHTGAGTAAKLVANAALFGTVSLLGEVLALAKALKLPRDKSFEVLGATPLAAQAKRRRPVIESRQYPPRFTLALAHKDACLVSDAAAAVGTDLRLLEAARYWLASAYEAGLGEADYTAVLSQIGAHWETTPSDETSS